MEDFLKEVAIATGKALLEAGIKQLKQVLTDDEIHDTVASIMPAMSESRKTQFEIESHRAYGATGRRDGA